MKNLESFQRDVLEIHYGESGKTVADVAKKHGVAAGLVEQELAHLKVLSANFSDLPQHEPSAWSLQKITAHANERAEGFRNRAAWWAWFKPALSFAAVLLAAFVVYQSWQGDIGPRTAQNAGKSVQAGKDYRSVVQRLFSTPFDKPDYDPTYPFTGSPYGNSLVSSVSLGNGAGSADDLLDDDLKILMADGLTATEVETLFFRARKLEKLGYFQDAVRDYLAVANSSLQPEYQKAVSIALANCYEKLGDKQTALLVLESYKHTFGDNEDITFWIDHLKSETF